MYMNHLPWTMGYQRLIIYRIPSWTINNRQKWHQQYHSAVLSHNFLNLSPHPFLNQFLNLFITYILDILYRLITPTDNVFCTLHPIFKEIDHFLNHNILFIQLFYFYENRFDGEKERGQSDKVFIPQLHGDDMDEMLEEVLLSNRPVLMTGVS